MKGVDYLASGCYQAPIAHKIEIRLAVAASLGSLTVEDGTSERMRTLVLDEVSALEVAKEPVVSIQGTNGMRGLPEGFRVYSRAAVDLKRGELLRVIYRRQRPY
jgi:hypothetical protein